MSSESGSVNSGTSILGLLGIAFVVLKLTGYIDWPWWWVTAPFWGGAAVMLAFAIVLLIFFSAAALIAFILNGK